MKDEKSKIVPDEDLYAMSKNHRIVGNYEDKPMERNMLKNVIEKILISIGLIMVVMGIVWLALKIIG